MAMEQIPEGSAVRECSFKMIVQTCRYKKKWSQVSSSYIKLFHLSQNESYFVKRLYNDFFKFFIVLEHIASQFLHKKLRVKDVHFYSIILLVILEHVYYQTKPYALKNIYPYIAHKNGLQYRKKIITALVSALQKTSVSPEMSMYKKLLSHLAIAYPKDFYDDYCRIIIQKYPIDIHVPHQDIWQKLQHEWQAMSFFPHHCRIPHDIHFSQHEFFQKGYFWVQNISAQFACDILNVQQHDHVLDIACAPGGKSMFFASKGAKVTAIDMNPKRLRLMQDNLDRVGYNIDIIQADFLDSHFKPTIKYDKIMLDAPCSAIGTMHQNPELGFMHYYHMMDSRPLHDIQYALLKKSWYFLKNDGLLVYAVCSYHQSEGLDIVKKSVDEGYFRPIPIDNHYNLPISVQHMGGGVITLYPHEYSCYGGVSGFTIALLQKQACYKNHIRV